LLSSNTIAQERIITGKVTAFQTVPLNNIKVLAKKTKNETLTDKNGNFIIKCNEDDQLTFSSVGFQNQKLKIKNKKDTININLFFINNVKNKESVVLNDYIDSETLEYALKNLPNQEKDYIKYENIYLLLQGEFPFLKIDGNYITLGIPNSVNSGNSALLIVNSNYVTDISFIQPRDVTSVKVLKGPEASTYGSRGANGVVIIEIYGNK